VYIYAPKACFSQVAKNCQVFCQTVGGVFLAFFQKKKLIGFGKLLEMANSRDGNLELW
jgi:hypothetical protein